MQSAMAVPQVGGIAQQLSNSSSTRTDITIIILPNPSKGVSRHGDVVATVPLEGGVRFHGENTGQELTRLGGGFNS